MATSFINSLHNFFLLLCVLLLTLLFMVLKIQSKKKNQSIISNSPPGSLGFPLIGETLAFISANGCIKGLYDFVERRHLKYGKCFKTKIFGETHVFLSSTESAKSILSGDSIDFSKRYMRSIAELLGDQSILCLSYQNHKFMRGIISNLFTSNSMDSAIKNFDELVIRTMAEWQQNEAAVVLNDAMKITFNAICKMLISLDQEEELEALQKDVSEISEAMVAFPLKWPGTRFFRGIKARERVMKALRRKIDMRRRSSDYYEDFLQSLLARNDIQNEEPLSDRQIEDNILTLIIAGQITTASAIAWMVKYLDENQQVKETLTAKQLELQFKFSRNAYLKLETLSEMSYASKIVKESLRMATIVSWFPRVALRDCQIEGFHIKKGWIVNVDARSIHHDPMLYADPFEFNPSRFDVELKACSFLAFGTGGRTCLGINLAKAFMMVFLHRLVTTYRWRVTDRNPSMAKWSIFPMLRSGCPIKIAPIATHNVIP
ncbi:abscisic acid 8'-hydroxylase 4 isoform X1 [Dendrobium catenatum]|uniref:Abscisic acid 8'-hydroxylase 4 n=1 Tax=Dendrobium catenatum TaxID=906689 RepID=A0A2I0XGC4_9ASPA|nr:abscisic acid 8'-hydroxylase 4 isoform X1 [Dendrobium catenatum]XP_028552461.1 abscisic acid 8'-hydroxylase 4 isoform X1 [Dendrobium catenatum]XP_028552462.1 abscisic acid 8'-hydroxylase 4 isoform X1 [Dendrobium catenatum]PKU86966.1 Abscisic acid 8'-hydroxylase 4 [Dendrobium catenatum]